MTFPWDNFHHCTSCMFPCKHIGTHCHIGYRQFHKLEQTHQGRSYNFNIFSPSFHKHRNCQIQPCCTPFRKDFCKLLHQYHRRAWIPESKIDNLFILIRICRSILSSFRRNQEYICYRKFFHQHHKQVYKVKDNCKEFCMDLRRWQFIECNSKHIRFQRCILNMSKLERILFLCICIELEDCMVCSFYYRMDQSRPDLLGWIKECNRSSK